MISQRACLQRNKVNEFGRTVALKTFQSVSITFMHWLKSRVGVGMLFCIQVSQKKSVSTPLGRHARIHPVGFSGTTPRRKDKRAKEGPRLTAPGNDSLQTLCRVTSANHNNPFKPPGKRDTKNRAAALFSAPIMRPQDKHLHGDE